MIPMNEQDRVTQIELARQGDADALQRLIVQYHASLHAAVERATEPSMARRIDPDDVLQEAYISALHSVRRCRFDSPGGFYKWLEKIAVNALKDHKRALRRQRRNVEREIHQAVDARTSYPDLVQRLAASDTTPSRHFARSEAVAAVLSSLARLTQDQRNVVRLRFLDGLGVAEVADRLGKSEAAIHMLCHRGLKALRDLLVSISRHLSRV